VSINWISLHLKHLHYFDYDIQIATTKIVQNSVQKNVRFDNTFKTP